jgi:hypothetical protein
VEAARIRFFLDLPTIPAATISATAVVIGWCPTRGRCAASGNNRLNQSIAALCIGAQTRRKKRAGRTAAHNEDVKTLFISAGP